MALRTCYGLISGRTRTFEKSTSVSGTYPPSLSQFPFIINPYHLSLSFHTFQHIANNHSEFDDRLQRTPKSKKISTAAGRVWKSEAFILTRIDQKPRIFSAEVEDKQFAKWTRADLLAYSVKDLVDRCDYIPTFSSDLVYTKAQASAALALFMKIASTCKGRSMHQVFPHGKPARLGPILESEGYDWFDVLSRRVFNWMSEFITEVLDPDHEAFKIHEAIIRAPRIEEPGSVCDESST